MLFSGSSDLKSALITQLNVFFNRFKPYFFNSFFHFFQPILVVWVLLAFLFNGLFGTFFSLFFLSNSLFTGKEGKGENLSQGVSSAPLRSHVPVISDYDALVNRNLFDSDFQKDQIIVDQPLVYEPQPSDAPFQLLAVIYGGRAETSVALIASKSNPFASGFRLYEILADLYVIRNITPTRVYFARPGEREEYLEVKLPELKKRVRKSRIQKSAGEGFSEEGFERVGLDTKVTREWVDRALTVNFTKTLQDAKANPYVEGGQIKGFMMTRIKPDSVYEKVGLQDGDVIREINGTPLENAAQSIQLLNSLRGVEQVSFVVDRDGSTQNFNIDIQ